MFERVSSEAGRVRLHLRGGLDGEQTEAMQASLHALALGEARDVIIDLSNVTFIDGSGVGAIAYLYKRLTARGCRLRVVGVFGQPLATLRHLGLARLLGLDEPLRRTPLSSFPSFVWGPALVRD